MNALVHLVETPLAEALGYALLHFVWQGVLVALLLGATLACINPSAARGRYAASCAALAALLIVFAVTVWWCLPGAYLRNLAVSTNWDWIRQRAPGSGSGIAFLPLRWAEWLPWLAPFWMAGVVLVWARVCLAWLLAQRLRRIGVCAAPPEWQQRMERAKQRMRVSQPVLLLESCLSEVPVVVGWLRPVILLPMGLLAGFPAGQVEAFLIHELAHIRRWDYLVNFAQSLAEGLLFYHPAVWWISGKLRAEREHCCDDVVVSLTGDARGYAVALTSLEEKRWAAVEAAMAANGGHLMRRVHRLLAPRKQRVVSAPVLGLLLLVALLGLAGWQAEAQVRTAGQPAVSPYEKWVNEDVAYIITQEERAAFQRLQSDDERQHFIAQFWERRDPTPGTPRNEAKEEYYRRISYANDHFRSIAMAGWKTDRGRIYIVYGPPDELDRHPNGGVDLQGNRVASPFEYWRYRFIQGIGNDVFMEFVDSTRIGNYQMTRDPAAK